MTLNPEIQKRIFDAADQLHQDSGRADFPTVDAVRRKARANMNDASDESMARAPNGDGKHARCGDSRRHTKA